MLNIDRCIQFSRQQFRLDKSVTNIIVIKDDRLMFVHNSKLFLDIQNVYQTDRWKNSKMMLGFEPGIFRKKIHMKIRLNIYIEFRHCLCWICWKEQSYFHQIIQIFEARNLDTFSVKMTRAFTSNQPTWVSTWLQKLKIIWMY